MSSRANPPTTSGSVAVKTPKTTAAAPASTSVNSSLSSKSSPKSGTTPLLGGVRRSSFTPTSSPTDRTASVKTPAPPASPPSRASTAKSSTFIPPSDAATAVTKDNNSASMSLPPPPPSIRIPSSSGGSAPAQVVPSVVMEEETEGDDARGWDPVMDGRFRVALLHRFAAAAVADDDDDADDGGKRTTAGGASSAAHPSAFANAVPEELNDDAAAECEEEAHRTPTHDAFCNKYLPGEPCVELEVEASLVNAINSAYTSTGYPFVVTSGNTRGAVYGSFVDTRNPAISSLELPPARSYVVAPSYTGGQQASHGLTEMDTLLAVQWGRGDRMMTAAGSAAAAAVAASQSKSAATGGGSGNSSAVREGKAASPGSLPRPTSATLAGAGPAGFPHSPAVARTIAHHLAQYPEGIHGIHTSPNLRRILIEGELPTEHALTPSAPLHATACAPLAVPGGSVGVVAAAAAAAGSGNSEEAAGSPTTAQPPTANAEANVPPLPRPSESNAPVQHTLVSASTYNHLSVYVVAHQDGRMLYTAALQSLSASIATRKVTAHQLILVGREEVHAAAGLSSTQITAVTSMPERRTKIAFTNVPVAGGEAAVFFQSKTSRFVGADATRRTVSAAAVRFTVEPHLIFGNQNGDIFIFSLLQERIVQHVNFNAGSAQVSTSLAGGNSGVGSKLICSSVSSIVEVQNGMEKKMASMVEYAMVAKRNHRGYFESDDVPSSFTPVGASEPTHYYYPVPPSLYAVGFDNGQMLLLCVTCEGGWMLRHFSSQYFGLRPIHAIAVRVPPFYTRLWTSCLPTIAKGEASASTTPITALVTPEQALIVHEEEQHIAAVACNGGVIALVRLPGMEIISSVAPTEYNAVGEILALQWTSTSTRHLLIPDVLVASGEDDTMTAFQLLWPSTTSGGESSYHPHLYINNGVDTVSHLSSNESILAGGRLRILEKKKFHRSWVNRLNLFPIALPAASTTPSLRGSSNSGVGDSSNARRASCATGGGMPQYLGVCLLATSYDRRTSFWPYIFNSSEDLAEDGNAVHDSLMEPAVGGHEFRGRPSLLSQQLASMAVTAAPDHYVLVDGPTAARPLHTELVVSVAAAGGGSSFFLTTVCCRGKVKFWSLKVKT
ncbi:hypothetical protein ABB37_09643 [Leptomonas pyrrhocoris]|uniref:Uncharacterized protein n=1 Tax=Leptomonas pyrrhocoris TaxID=157538 RepID=A0A0N0DQZ3_LEPPY|nr:hypothetical protein ABB37_09643 [Leptomonas pyrrhocoris]XP_015652174.1 hypothetical protein ABB37_09643 [Leptomonas pyrrhocoris]KPA73734.1 hypothetical protein ABB37_09643 [Leptomonas pyrrhocoris]KPA73735.1 hypothetical protein ABB37_09643 [Leptomonas pyrrhocoris]|eukprot:XP_015652173.1 hypothetical protein ABB37_09643 [Leptomonas pyrrhocoris]